MEKNTAVSDIEKAAQIAIRFTAVPGDLMGMPSADMRAKAELGERIAEAIREIDASHPAPQAAAEGVGELLAAMNRARNLLQSDCAPAAYNCLQSALDAYHDSPAAPERAAIQQAGEDTPDGYLYRVEQSNGEMSEWRNAPRYEWHNWMTAKSYECRPFWFAAIAAPSTAPAPDAEAIRSAALEEAAKIAENAADISNEHWYISARKDAALQIRAALSQPSPAVKSAEPTEHPAITVLREVKMEDVAGYKERGFVISTGLRAKIQALLNEAGDDPFMSAEPTGGAA